MQKVSKKLTRSISLILASALLPIYFIGVGAQTANAAAGAFHVNPSPHEAYVMPYGHLNITYGDLQYILDQIKISEAHAARTVTSAATLEATNSNPSSTIIYPYDVTSVNRCLTNADLLAATAITTPTSLSDAYPFNVEYPWGLRQVDGQCNNIHSVAAETAPSTVYTTPIKASDPAGWGAADQLFTRLSPSAVKPTTPYALNDAQQAYQDPSKSVRDPSPREISNLISDQSTSNPAAVAAGIQTVNTLYGETVPATEYSVNAGTGAVSTVVKIPNVTSDFNSSAGYNSWFTLFGQFFDHGLDLIPKAGASVLIPLMQDDPLYVASANAPNFMVLTRGADGTTGESMNTTTPYVDQSQTYGSHPSQNFFLREYKFATGTGVPTSTGRLIEGTDVKYTNLPSGWTSRTVGGTLTHPNGSGDIGNGGLATWRDIKAQAKLLGFNLTDYDARSIPVIATDQYGKFIRADNNFPMMLFTNGSSYVWEPGNPAAPIGTGAKTSTDPAGGTSLPGQTGSNWFAVSTGHAFLNDTMASAVPFTSGGTPLAPDADAVMNSANVMPTGYYDDENLNEHYISGDGRLNENIGLSAIHHLFHAEHNLLAQDITDLLNNDPEVTPAFKSEWISGGVMNGERLYQAARLVNEMEYQHMVYDEFIRRIAPSLPMFTQYDPNLNADIPAEFASAVYRVGHSMLNETIARSNPGEFYDVNNNQDVALLNGFTNPAQARMPRPMILNTASWSGSDFVFTMNDGETPPQVGQIVSTSEMESSDFNLNSAVVRARTATTFTVSTYYPGGASASAVALPSTGLIVPSNSRRSPDNLTNIAYVSINDPSGSYDYSPGSSAAAIAQGMSSQRGNEIDEFVTDAVRNNLLGLPLDLASLNITRGRDVGVPTLNQFRSQRASSLAPYTSWRDFIGKLRYPESGVNFVAAYGTHSTLSNPVTIANITSATATTTTGSRISISYTYSAPTDKEVKPGDVVSITGFASSAFNISNAIVDSADGSHFVITSNMSHAASDIISYSTSGALYAAATPSKLTGSAGSQTDSAVAKREPNMAEKRQAALALVASSMPISSSTYPSIPTAPADALAFMTSSGSWAGKETGFNNVDLWMGGLAENPAKQPITPPVLGTTFQFVFENVALKLQNGDRFYYLSRLMGKNLGEEIPAQKLTDILRRNTPSASATISRSSASGILGMNSPGFSISDCAFASPGNLVPTSAQCDAASLHVDPNSGILIHEGLDNVTGFGDPSSTTGVKIMGGGGDDGIFGSAGDDLLLGDIGGDLIDGAAGDDIILGGAGEDLIKGGPGNDVINTGDNQIGEIADGGSGDDFIHSGDATGFAASLFGETGNDFIQGTSNLDIFLGGGEGDDWVEGGGDQENAMYGDSGPTFAAQQPTLGPGLVNGGNDVLNGGPGYDALFGNGGDDIFFAGDGIDTIQGDGGFDWLDYEANVRFDNGATRLPSVFMDLSATIANPVSATTEDQVVDIEGLSGSSGNDVLTGRLAADVTVPTVITGLAGATSLVLPGTVTGIDAGMRVTGTGIGRYATTVAQGRTSVINGVTVTTVDLTDQNSGAVTGPVTFSIWPLENPGLITGLTDVLSSTPGWVKHTTGNPSATIWSGGTILLGGDGNDTLRPIAGENVMHGSVYLHTCIKVNHVGFANTGADVPCGTGVGYSSMTNLGPWMDNGTLNPTELSIVRELVPTSSVITSYIATANAVTYTAANDYYVGESISISGIADSKYNLVNAIVTSATPTTFTVTSNAGEIVATPVTGARSVATDTVALVGTVDQYSIVPFTPLPAGTSSGYKIISQDGSQDIVFDVQMVSFAGAPAVPISASMPALTSLTITPGTFGQAFTPNTTDYTFVVNHLPADVTEVTVTPVTAAVGATIRIRTGGGGGGGNQGTAVTSGQAFKVKGLSTTGTTTIRVIVTALDGVTQTTYSIVVSHAGLVPIMQEHTTATTNTVVISVTNYDSSFTFTPTVTTSTPHNPGVPAVTVTAGTPNGLILPITVNNLLASESAVVTVTTARNGFTAASATKTVGATAGGALVATFGNIVSTSDGFTVNMTNYSSLYSLAITTSAGSVAQGTASGSNLPLTVSGLTKGQSATVTIVATRAGYTDGTSGVVGNATLGGALTPTLDSASGTSTGFTFNVTNYDPAYQYVATTNRGSVVSGTPSSGNLPFTVSGLGLNTSATVTVTATKAGTAPGSATVSGTANPLQSGGTITVVGTPSSSSAGSQIALSISSTTAATGTVTYSTNTANCFINGSYLTATTGVTCSVVAVQASDGNFAAATSSAATFVFAATNPALTPQATLTLSGSAGSVTVGSTITLSVSGGTGNGQVYYYTDTAGCSISTNILSASTGGTCNVIAIKVADSTYAGTSSAPISFVFNASNLLNQSPLSIAGTPTTTTVGSTIALTRVGGSGNGAVTFSTNTTNVCSINGSVLTALAAGACVVVVTKASDGIYGLSTGNSTFNITNVIDIGNFAFTNGVFSNVAGTSVNLIAAGGPGTGKVTYATATAGCLVRGAVLTVTKAPVDCSVSAVKAASAGSPSALTIYATFSFSLRPQAVLRISNAVKTGLVHTSRITLTAAGGSGTGAIVYTVSGAGCTVGGATLTSTGATTCSVTATKAASSIYSSTTAVADFVFKS